MLHTELKSKIRKLWDRFWSGGISNPLQAIEQISYLIFMKRLEDRDIQREQEAQLKGEEFHSLFENCPDCKWGKWIDKSGEEMFNHVRDKVFPFMRELGTKDSLYSQYMKNANFEIPTSSLLVQAVKMISDMHIKQQNQDAQGDIYEYLLSELQTAGKNGQFRTPRQIIRMMVELSNPQYGDIICDPACGTAGFLVNAYEHILKQNTSKDLIKTDEEGNEYNFKADKLNAKQKKILDEESLYGFDIDQTMARIALMNMMMHGITNPSIDQKNTLSKSFNADNTYDLILANPPFKGSIDISEMNDNFRTRTKKTELLFLELMYNSLVRGGRCTVIVPDGVLFGNSNAHKQIRELILKKCRLDAVIKMPSGVFKPYAGVSTAVLFFTKGEPTKKVWFYDMHSDGYSLDDKRTPIKENDIPDILKRFENRFKEKNEDRSKKHFFVPIEEIEKNEFDLSISKYKRIEYEEIEYRKKEVILSELQKENIDIGDLIKELKS